MGVISYVLNADSDDRPIHLLATPCVLFACSVVYGSNLTVSSVGLSDEGNFVCTVTDSQCTSRNVVAVKVIWGQPCSLSVTISDFTRASE